MRGLRDHACLWFVLALLGCGSSGQASGADDGAAPSPDGATSRDAASAATGRGTVTVLQSVDINYGSPTYNGKLSAVFTKTAESPFAAACTVSTAGDCQIVTCPAGAKTPAPTETVSAGKISVSGASVPAFILPEPGGVYSPMTNSSTGGPFIPPGATLQITAAGADVPAFEGSLSIGGAVTLTSPTLTGVQAHLSSGDLPVTWSGGSTGSQLQLDLSANSAAGASQTVAITCTFSGGSGTVPASAMATMANVGSLAYGPFATTTLTAGSYSVTLNAQVISAVGVFTK